MRFKNSDHKTEIMGSLQSQVGKGGDRMVVKERKLWKQEPADQIRDFVMEIYNKEAEKPCPVDRLKVLSDTLRRSSCGECVICREGILQLYTMTESITQGNGRDGDMDVISEISEDMCIGSGCDYGKEVGKIAKDIIDTERDQFERHIKRKRCDALVCKKFFLYYISPEKCSGCHQCVGVCKAGAISGSEGLIHIINPTVCTKCGACTTVCEPKAIQKSATAVPNLPTEPIPVGSFQSDSNQGGLLSQKRRRRSE